MVDLQHVHIGSGSLGLGLIGDILYDADFQTIMFNRINPKRKQLDDYLIKNHKYDIISEDNTGITTKNIDKHSFELYDSTDNTSENNLTKSISDKNTFLITTSVKPENLKIISNFILMGILERYSNGYENPLAVIACENIKDNSSVLKKFIINRINDDKELIKFINTNICFCNTIVHRICRRPGYDTQDNKVKVRTSTGKYWHIDSSNISKEHIDFFESQLSKNVMFEDRNSFKMLQKQKYWCFNGIHLAIALYSHLSEYPDIRHVFNNLDIMVKINAIQLEFQNALYEFSRAEYISDSRFSKVELKKYNQQMLEDVKFIPDDAYRILGELMHLGEIQGMVEFKIEELDKDMINIQECIKEIILNTYPFGLTRKIYERIIEPIRILAAHNLNPKSSIAFLSDIISLYISEGKKAQLWLKDS